MRALATPSQFRGSWTWNNRGRRSPGSGKRIINNTCPPNSKTSLHTFAHARTQPIGNRITVCLLQSSYILCNQFIFAAHLLRFSFFGFITFLLFHPRPKQTFFSKPFLRPFFFVWQNGKQDWIVLILARVTQHFNSSTCHSDIIYLNINIVSTQRLTCYSSIQTVHRSENNLILSH